MQCRYSLDAELNSASNDLSHSEFEKKHREICRKYEQKKYFSFMTNMSIQPLWLNHFIEILLVLEFQLTKFIAGLFSYKAILDPKFPLMAQGPTTRFDLCSF